MIFFVYKEDNIMRYNIVKDAKKILDERPSEPVTNKPKIIFFLN